MKRKKGSYKKGIAAVLGLLLAVCGMVPYIRAASVAEKGPNAIIFDNLITDRRWVEQTFRQDRFPADNPYAVHNGVAGQDYLYQEPLQKYQEDKAFRAGVNVYYTIENWDGQLMELPSALADKFLTDASWGKFLDGAKNKNYEAVLNKVFSTNYTSDAGNSLNVELSNLMSMRTGYKVVKDVKDFADSGDDLLGFVTDVNNVFQQEYAGEILN